MADTILNVTTPVISKKKKEKKPDQFGYYKRQSVTKTISNRKSKMKK